jgi:RNA-dependent RNA polymerase
MRKLEAVDIHGLHHLVNCIVFPAKGPRPHTDEISGSDLDGDKYFVTWYEPFLTPEKNAKPMDFASPEKKVLDRSVDVNDMIDFIAEYIKNDQLGIIANAHLVHADAEEKGAVSFFKSLIIKESVICELHFSSQLFKHFSPNFA